MTAKNSNQQSIDQLNRVFTDAVIFAVDSNGCLSYWNSMAENLFGYKAKEVVGQSTHPVELFQHCIAPIADDAEQPDNGKVVQLTATDGQTIRFKRYREYLQGEGSAVVQVLIPVQAAHTGRKISVDTDADCFHGLLSVDASMQEIFKLVSHVARTEVSVLIRGESGTGKELIARALHEESLRHDKPFLAINCAALSSSVLESELFGHVKGAFTDAIRNHVGLIERADGGTLFLDEVAEIPMDLQAKLLRVIQEREFMPVGSEEVKKVDIRILAATHHSLRKRVKEGLFREDLMFRLRVVPIFLPPLRERKRDISLLLYHYLQELQDKGQARIDEIAPDVMNVFLNYPWPGNVRELRNVVEYANAVSHTPVMETTALPPEFMERTQNTHIMHASVRGMSEKKRIQQALLESDGNLEITSEVLGISRTTLWRKRKKYRI